VIITQTPLRISFAGGGTDLAPTTPSARATSSPPAIDKFVYVIVKERFDDAIYLNTMKKEIRAEIDEIEHELIREAMRLVGVERGVEVTLLSDIPSEGAGLGSSSSFTVGLLNAFHVYCGEQVTAEQLAQEACRIEIDVLGKPIGKQDQYIAAVRRAAQLPFRPRRGGRRRARRAVGAPAARARRAAAPLLHGSHAQGRRDPLRAEGEDRRPQRRARRDQGARGGVAPALECGDFDRLGEILHRNWELKRQLASGISDASLDEMYELARAHGALGGKICGAGGGGFLLVYCPLERSGAARERACATTARCRSGSSPTAAR
jgi:D-glycero-alpha-D-manno-heptose-7-phosphate kinase